MISRKFNELLFRATGLLCIAVLLTGLLSNIVSPTSPAEAAASLSLTLLNSLDNAAGVTALYSSVMADFNLDGINDLAASDGGGASVSVWLGNGEGSFSNATAFASGGAQPYGLAVGDVNLDGIPDLAVANDSGATAGIGILLGVGDGTFSAPQVFSTGYASQPLGIVIADFNEDGKPDVAAANGNAVTLLNGNGDGTFQPFISFPTNAQAYNLAVGDFNSDNHLDVAVSNHGSGTISVLLGNGGGSFGAAATYFAGGNHPIFVSTGDFNHDHILDLATVTDLESTLEILMGNGDGTFTVQPAVNLGGVYYPRWIGVADFDVDGNVDLAIAIGQTPNVLVLKGNGDLTFASPVFFFYGGLQPNFASLVVGNLTGDKMLDIAVMSYGSNRVYIFKNTGDTIPPSISATVMPQPNINGWWNTAPTITYSCSDSGSGVASVTPDTTIFTEGANQSVTGVCEDVAGNLSTTTVSGLNIDLTKPDLIGTASTAPNGNGWYNNDVLIHWTCSDALSGIAGLCPTDSLVTGEGDTLQASATVSDQADNNTITLVSPIKIDRTAPNTDILAPSGWNDVSVNVSLVPHDALSGVANTSYSLDGGGTQDGVNILINSEGVHTLEYWSEDNASNEEIHRAAQIDIDLTPPTISPTVSPNTIPLNGSAIVSANANDALSGIAFQSCEALDTSTAGAKTVSCTATDNAGNSSTASASYTVSSDNGFTFTGFFQPVDNLPTINQMKSGRGVQIKFSLGGDQGLNIFAAGYPTSQQIPCASNVPVDNIETTVVARSSSLSYDPLTDQYTYTWMTDKMWAKTCREMKFLFTDGTLRSAQFKFK